MNPLESSVYLEDDPFRIPFPKELLKVAQDQYSNNEEARAVRVQEVLCPFLGDPDSRTDLIALFVEHLLIEDDALADVLFLDIDEVMQVWEARPISMFSCLMPSCREPIPVRNRKHLLRLLRVEKYFGLRVAAGDLVEFKTLCELLCDTCSREQRYCHEQQVQAVGLAHQARKAQLRRMTLAEYLKTPEWRALRNRALIQAGNRCQVCSKHNLQLDVHHNSYQRYGDEQLSDLVVLCRDCHQHFHGILPEAA